MSYKHIEKLKNSPYKDDIKRMLDSFERSVKPTFTNSSQRSFIRFGTVRDRDPSVGIQSGQLPLEG
jgi:hypothetical protein